MALYAVAIEKECRFHGNVERFGNVYYYEGPIFQAGDENYRRLVEYLTAEEKKVHDGTVTFRTGRIWSSGGTVLQNITLGLFDLSGTGTLLTSGPTHAEAAVLVEFECSRPNILGRKVYLRKYIRSQGLPQGHTQAMAGARDALSDAVKAPYKAFANAIDRISLTPGVEAQWQLVSPTGRVPRAEDNGVVDPFIRTREFRRN